MPLAPDTNNAEFGQQKTPWRASGKLSNYGGQYPIEIEPQIRLFITYSLAIFIHKT